MQLSNITEVISQSTTIGITFHTSPDGDSLGSALALFTALRNISKHVYIISKEALPDSFGFLPFSDEISGHKPNPSLETDLVIVLDCGNKARINAVLDNFTGKIINIDHHVTNELYGDINYVDSSAAATAEIVYSLILALNTPITQDIATCLYTSLLTDTGSFKYSSTSNNTHRIAGALIDTGIDFTAIHRLVYDNKDFKYIKLTAKVLDNLYLMHKDTICVMEIKEDLLRELDYYLEDSSELVAYGLTIKGVEVAALFKEKNGGVKVSLRSKDKVDVRKVAEFFSGGGHIKASGIFLPNISIEEAKKAILQKIKDELI